MTDPNAASYAFQAKDHAGNTHEYSALLVPADDGFELSLELVAALGEPLFAALGGLGEDDGDEDDMDLSALGPALKGIEPKKLARLGRRLLSLVTRDGQALSNSHTFNTAYRGNYVELYTAIMKVVQENRFLPLPGTFDSL